MRIKWLNFLVLTAMVLGLFPVGVSAAPATDAPVIVEVEPGLRQQLQADEGTGYLIYFHERPDLSKAYAMDWITRGRFVTAALQATAERSQARVRAYLDAQGADYQAFWIDNVIAVEKSNLKTFNTLTTAFPEVKALRAHRQLQLYEATETAAPAMTSSAIEPNILHVLADQVWAEGYTGQGIVVASVDTGVRYTHNALVNHYRGNLGGGTFDHNYNWWDPYGNHPTAPGDDNGHGTHTMGTMVGDDGGANQIGMAPGAKWVACRGCNTSSCTDTALLECAEFFAAPWDLTGANANPDKRPNAVNNSWGDCSRSYDPWYQDVVDAWHAAGIYPVFSNGNASNCGYPAPPGLNTVGNPARYGNVTGVGSSGRDNGQYATHSNWGPTDNPDTVNPKPGWADLKPQVLAPGVNIRSSVNSGDSAYQGGWSGTSMSAPHVTGLVALMWSAAPCLIGDYATTETIIEDTATPIPYDDGTGGGAHVPNYATGWGEINALAAVEAAAASCGDSAIVGQVTDVTTSAPIAGATVVATSEMAQRQATSNAEGLYVLTVFSGTYTLAASRYGYRTTVIPDVTATTGTTTTQNIALTPAAMYEVSGKVTDATTGWPLYAHISISGDPVGPLPPDNSAWTNPATGAYSLMLAEGVTYTFEVEAWVDGYGVSTGKVGPLTADVPNTDFAVQPDMVACTAPGYHFVGGLMANFEDKTFPPAGWTVVNNGGTCDWVGNDPGGRGNLTGGTGKFAIADSDACGSGTTMNTDLVSPPFDVSGLSQVNLSFAYDYNNYTAGEVAAVEVSANNGASWVNVVTWTTDQRGPATFSQNVTGILAGSTQARVRFHYYAPSWDWWWEVDNVVLGNPVCQPPTDGGLVVGNVYDANFPTLALNGATVVNATGGETTAKATPADPAVDDAFYTLFAPSGAQALTAMMTGGYAPDTATVTVVKGGTVKQDFQLPAGLLEATPAGIAATVELGYADSATLTLANTGDAGATFELKEHEGRFTPLHIEAYTGELQSDGAPVSTGLAPRKAASVGQLAPTASPLAGAAPAFAIDLFTGNLGTFMSDAPGAWTDIGPVGLGGPFAGDFLGGDFSQMYVLDYDTNGFYVVDTATGVATEIGTSTPQSGQVWTGMTGFVDGTLYAASTDGGQSYLYTVDPATGATTVVGEITNAPVIIDIAINADGEMYGVDIGSDVLVAIDPATGAGTVVGSLGYNANYAQGMDFEEESGVLYWAAYGTSGELRIIDAETGASTSVGAFPGGAEVDCLAFATGGAADVPWLTETPVSGSVPAQGNTSVTLGFDAAYVDQPGEYHAELIVKNDTPYGKFSVPVTMTVTAPTSWGKLTGTVTGLGVCDGDPAPLEEAEVVVESATTGQVWTLATDENGRYTLWIDQAHSPVTITVTAPDYFGETGGVVVKQGKTTVVDFNLRLLKPCLSYDPADFDVTLPMGNNTVEPLTLSNTGAADANVTLVEVAGWGFVPLNAQYAPLGVGPAERLGSTSAGTHAIQPNQASVIQDGGFEAGTPNPYWDEYSFNFGTPICDVPSCGTGTGTGPRSGAYWTWFGGISAYEEGYVAQDVVIPSGAATLSFWLEQAVCNSAADYMEVLIDGVQVFYTNGAHPYCGTVGYWQENIDVSDFADGGTHIVEFYSETSSGGVTNFFVDDVTLTVIPGGVGGDNIPWVSENPVSGIVTADGELHIALTFDAGVPETMQPGTYSGRLRVNSDAANDVPNIPITLTVTPPESWGKIAGVVTGLGYCDVATPTLLAGAVVTLTSGTGLIEWTLATDENGAYQFWLDEAHSPVTITVAYLDHVTQVFTNVVVTAGETTTVDAALRWAKPCLTVDPDMFSVTVTLGMSTTVPFTLTNAGAGDTPFDLAETNGGVNPLLPQLLAPTVAATGGTAVSLLQFGESKVTLEGSAVSPHFSEEDILLDQVPNADNGIFSDAGCDICTSGVQVVAENFSLDTEETIGQIVLWSGYYSGDTPIDPDHLTVIFHADASGSPGTALSTETDVPYERVQTGVVLFGVHEWMHTLTLANPVTLAPGTYWVEIYNDTGYGTDDFFWETGNADTVGNGLTGSAWATQAPGSSWNIDTATEMSIQLIRATGGAGGDIPWLSENPVSGAVAADSTSVVDLTFDASSAITQVTQIGEYFGTLFVNSNDPVHNKIAVPVTMTVTPPATWGKLLGTVTGLGYCDADPAPLAGAEVLVESWMTHTTTVMGTFQQEDFEATNGGYTHSGTADEWAWGTPTAWPNACASGTRCWGTDLAGNYENSSNQTLQSPVIDLSSFTPGDALTVAWQQAWSTESGWDYAYAEVSINGGAWTQMWSGAGTGNPWTEKTYDISGAAGGTVQFRWRLTSDSSMTYPGYYIDNVRILGPVEIVEPVNWPLTTDVSGTYQVWIDEMYSPVTITVSYPEHEKGEAIAVITGGNTTTQDFDLRWLVPCVQVDPLALHATLELGDTASTVLTLTNAGAVDTAWSLTEENLGEDLTGPPPQQLIYLSEDFESTFPPAGWTRVENIGSCDWESSATTGYTNQTGGTGLFADANSDWCGDAMDVELWSPALDLSAAAAPVLSFQSDFNDYGGADDGYVDVSTDGGTTWTNLLHYDGVDVRGPLLVELDLSAYAGQPSVIIRFHYVAPDWDWYWQVDDVLVGEPDIDQVTWLAETPTSGVLVADTGEQVVAVGFDASVVEQPGDYLANLWVHSDDPFAPAILPVTMTVTPPATWGELRGTVTSLGRCDVNPAPLEGATVVIVNGTSVTLTTDISGAYSYWLLAGTYTVTVAAADHVGDAAVVTVPAAGEVTQDFSLTWLGPCVTSITPSSMEVTVAMGMSETLPLTMTNAGAGPLNFAFLEANGGFVPTLRMPLQQAVQASSVTWNAEKLAGECAAYADSSLAEPAEALACYDHVPEPAVFNMPFAPGDTGYAQDIGYVSDNFVTFTLDNFAGQTVVGTSSNAYYGMDFDPSATTLYALNDTTDQLGTINLATGAFTGLVPCPPGGGAANWTGLTIDPINGTFYASTATDLYIINPATGASTLVGPFGTSLMIDIAMNPAGEMYGHDIGTDSIYQIDPATGAATLVGPTGYNANYAQGMDFDNDDGTLYVFLYQGSGANVFGTVNLTSGAVTPLSVSAPLGEFEGAIQIPGAKPIPWLFEDPESGAVPPAMDGVADITFDAGVPEVTQPGTYAGLLTVNNNDPVWDGFSIPVTMHVTLPPTYGQITGAVTGLGPCDDPATAGPLEGADVTIASATQTWTLTTDAAGGYLLWLDEAHSPVTLTVEADGYVTQVVTGVQVISGTTTVQDVALQPKAPCMSVTPTSIHETVTLGDSATVPMSIGNTGAAGLNWAISETGGGYTALRPAPAGFTPAGPAPALAATTVSPESTVVVAPQPAAASASVLWNQPVSASNTNAYANQDFETANDAYDIFIADDFVNGDAWNISTIFVPGGLWNGGSSLMNATTLNWQIYADAGGKPAGDPWGNGAAPVWAVSLAPNNPQVVISMGTDGLMGNATVNLNVPALIPAGHWWLVFYPSMAFSSGGQFGRQWSDTTNGAVAQVVNPGGGFGLSTTWSSAQTAWGVPQQDFAFRLEGEIADVPWLSENPQTGVTPAGDTSVVDITLDAGVPEVVQPGDYYATLKVEGDNATVEVPVTMTVEAPDTWGKLTGLVQSLGYCDAMTTPLQGAVVFVESAVTELVTYTVDSVVFEQDFEGSDGGFTHSGTYDEWEWGAPSYWLSGCASGSRCWGTDLDSTYENNADQTLLSPVIDLSGVTPGSTLTAAWQQAWYIESATWDHAYAEVSINGGAWMQMWAHTGSTAEVGWTPMSFNISAAAGGTVQFRWRLTSDSSMNYAGYYIDALRITTPVEVSEWRPLNWTLTTGADGMYGWWFDSAYNPFTVTISYEAGYEAQVFTDVNVTGEAITTLNANLHWLQPCMTVAPNALALSVTMGTTATLDLNLANLGAITGTFLLNEWSQGFNPLGPLAVGGPDNFGYQYADSNAVGWGPSYAFVDISAVGKSLTLGDNAFAEVPIGFDFKFYGDNAVDPNFHDTLFVSSNGFLSFGAGSTDISPDPVLPNPTLPNNLIAAAWYDLVPGTVYYQSFTQCPYNPSASTVDACFIVQYVNFTHKDGSPAGTWEVVLFRSGSILMQYADVNAPDATTGIEGPLGLDGLTYGPTLADELAICFAYPGEWLDCQSTQVPWLAANPSEGKIAAYDDATIAVTFDASVPEVSMPGDYLAELWIASNDPVAPFQVIPVTMTVTQPTTMGRLAGVVSGWSHCDTVSETLAGAQVVIATSDGKNVVLTTDADGAYAAWLPVGPYTLTVSAEGYVPVTFAGAVQPTMQSRSVDLRLDAPCVNVTYDQPFDVVVVQGQRLTRTLTLNNRGAGRLTYNNVLATGLWLTVDPKAGSVAPDSAQPVNVIFDATGLDVGVYNSSMEIVHNDTKGGRLFIRPIRMTVVAQGTVLTPVTDAKTGNPGETVTYVMTVTNSIATAVTFDIAATGNVWTTTAPATVTVAANGTVTFTVDVDIPADAHTGDSDTVIVKVTSQGADGQVGEAVLQTTVAEQPVVLALTKAANPAEGVLPGDVVTYTLTLANNGNDPLTIALTDLIPAGVTYIAGSVTGGASLQDPPARIVWEGVLAKGAQQTITFKVTINADVARGSLITNTVTATVGGVPYTAQATVHVRPQYSVYLPLVFRNAP